MASNSNSEDFHDIYEVMEKVGEGCYGQVYRCVDKETKQEFAVKMICTSRVREDVIKDEIAICQKLNHRNIVKLLSFYDKDIVHFLVFDMVYGGQLIDDITTRVQYSEFDACQCIEQILKGVEYLHKLNIVHRDLKANNILLTDKDKDSVVKIADFGAAGEYTEDQFFVYTGGIHSYYMSPEMCSRRLSGRKVDIWSCGVLLYVMLVGRPPFRSRDGRLLISQMKGRAYSFISDDKNDFVCDDAKDLIDQLLDPNPITRLTATAALNHPFIRQRTTVTSRFHRQSTIEELKKHRAEIQDRWKRAISAVVFKNECERIARPEKLRRPPKMDLIGRSSAVDHGDEAKGKLGESSLDPEENVTRDMSLEDLDATGSSAGNLSFLETVAGCADRFWVGSLRVVLFPLFQILHFFRMIFSLFPRRTN